MENVLPGFIKLMHSDWFLVPYLQGDGVESEVPHVSDGIVQSLLDAPQLGCVLLQKPAVLLQLNLCVYF